MRKFYLLLIVFVLVACGESKKTANPKIDSSSTPFTEGLAPSSKGNVLAELNGEAITEQEVYNLIKSRLSRIENQIYEIKKDAIDQIVEEKLLAAEAKKRALTIQELIKKEIQDKVGEISLKEIQDFYHENKSRVGNRTLEELKSQIEAQLKMVKSNTYRNNLMDRLMASANLDVYIKRPSVEVGIGNSPSKGPADAAVTIIEFTDYQCPFCVRVRPTIKQILDIYKKDVRYVLRSFPLDFHSNAKKASAASLCAKDQNKFWEYNDKLWENQSALEVASLKKYAADLKLDTKKFDECLDSDKYMNQVNQDQQEGMKAGVSGTPSFFVNGKMLTGAQPFEAFKQLIDEELKEAKKRKG